MGSDIDISALAEAVVNLQRRVSKLEFAAETPASIIANEPCPDCGSIQVLIDEKSHPRSTRFRVRTFTYTKCSRTSELDWSVGG